MLFFFFVKHQADRVLRSFESGQASFPVKAFKEYSYEYQCATNSYLGLGWCLSFIPLTYAFRARWRLYELIKEYHNYKSRGSSFTSSGIRDNNAKVVFLNIYLVFASDKWYAVMLRMLLLAAITTSTLFALAALAGMGVFGGSIQSFLVFDFAYKAMQHLGGNTELISIIVAGVGGFISWINLREAIKPGNFWINNIGSVWRAEENYVKKKLIHDVFNGVFADTLSYEANDTSPLVAIKKFDKVLGYILNPIAWVNDLLLVMHVVPLKLLHRLMVSESTPESSSVTSGVFSSTMSKDSSFTDNQITPNSYRFFRGSINVVFFLPRVIFGLLLPIGRLPYQLLKLFTVGLIERAYNNAAQTYTDAKYWWSGVGSYEAIEKHNKDLAIHFSKDNFAKNPYTSADNAFNAFNCKKQN